ncbi:MAG TPA: hypothetical protein VK477_05395 [Acidobacteriota bacterium]|nr:hypothetical protein [Acidobacteriota bacterium]
MAVIDREIKRSVLWFFLAAVPVGFLVYWLIPEPKWKEQIRFDEQQPFDVRPIASATAAFLSGFLAQRLGSRTPGRAPAEKAENSDASGRREI